MASANELRWGVVARLRGLVCLCLCLSAPALVSCAEGQGQADTPVARNTANLQAWLIAGPWRLVDYRPDVALEPVLQAMLLQQVRSMVVRFDGRTLSAQSPTLNVVRPYTLENVVGYEFDVVSPNQQGGGMLRSRCQISEDGRRIVFRAETDPWNGTGILQREP